MLVLKLVLADTKGNSSQQIVEEEAKTASIENCNEEMQWE